MSITKTPIINHSISSQNPITRAFQLDPRNICFRLGRSACRSYQDDQPPISLSNINRAHWRAGYEHESKLK